MYQTVIILLVTAVVTIITTIVTVRVTMTGRVMSQNAKERFRAKAKKYGNLVLQFALLCWSIFWLAYNVLSDEPVTRGAILVIAIWVLFCGSSASSLVAIFADFWQARRYREETANLLNEQAELKTEIEALTSKMREWTQK